MSEDVRTRPAADVLLELNRGRSHRELSDELQKLVAAVQETGKKGTLTLTITVSPSKLDGALEVSDKIVAKLPEFPRGSSIFFVDGEHNLVRDDPRQIAMQFPRDVSADRPADARERAAGEL